MKITIACACGDEVTEKDLDKQVQVELILQKFWHDKHFALEDATAAILALFEPRPS